MDPRHFEFNVVCLVKEMNGTGKTPSPVKEHQRAAQLQEQQRRRQQQQQQQLQQMQQQQHHPPPPPPHVQRGAPRMDLRNGLPPAESRHGYPPLDPRSNGPPDHHYRGDPRNGLLIDPRALGPPPPHELRDPRSSNGPVEQQQHRMAAASGHPGPDPRLMHDTGRYGPPQEAALRLDSGRHYAEAAGGRSQQQPPPPAGDQRLVSPQQQQLLAAAEAAGRRADSRGSDVGGRVETKTVFSIFAKSENDAKMSKFSRNFASQKCSFSRKFDILRYFTIFPVSCVRFLIHFRFRENFRYFRNFS
jgi:hypothetical protein